MIRIYADGQLLNHPLNEKKRIHSPRMTAELGKAGSVSFTIPPDHALYNTLKKLKTQITVKWDDDELFRGRCLSFEKNTYNAKQWYCEGDLSYLVDTRQPNDSFSGTVHGLFRKVINHHNATCGEGKEFIIGEITVDDDPITISGTNEEIQNDSGEYDYRQIAINASTLDRQTTLDYVNSNIIGYCGGYLRTRRSGNTIFIDLVKEYGETNDQAIEFGVNLLDFAQESTAENIWTVLIPIGEDGLTIESVNNGSDELVDDAAVAEYGRITKTYVFENVTNANTLLADGQKYLAARLSTPDSFRVLAVDMHYVNPEFKTMKIGQKIRLNTPPHEIDAYYTCTKIEYDFENPDNTEYNFGTPRQTLTERYRQDAKEAARKSSGGSIRGSGAVGSAAEKAVDNGLKNFYDAWVDVNDEDAYVSIGALSRVVDLMKRTLETEVGINLDGVSGNINISSIKKTVDEHGEVLKTQAANISLMQTDLEAYIESNTAWVEDTNETITAITQKSSKNEASITALTKLTTDQETAIASITQTVNTNEASIATLTEWKNANAADISSIASIRQTATQNESSISAMAKRVSDNETAIAALNLAVGDAESNATLVAQYGERLAAVEAKANDNESAITLRATKVYVDAEITEVKDLIANSVTADRVKTAIANAGTITCTVLKANQGIETTGISCSGTISDGSGGYFATQEWVLSQLKNYSKTGHTHSGYSSTDHTHSFSDSFILTWNHSHNSSGTVSEYLNKTIVISGTTGTPS